MNTSERTLLIAVCSMIIIVIVVVLVTNFLRAVPQSSPAFIFTSQKQASVDLSFHPSTIVIPKTSFQSSYQATIMAQAHGTSVLSVQIELTFDPHVISSFSFQESSQSIFAKTNHQVLLNFVDLPNGRASWAEAITSDGNPQPESGPLVNVLFTVNPIKSASSKISFLKKSQVSTIDSNKSILGTTQALLIAP